MSNAGFAGNANTDVPTEDQQTLRHALSRLTDEEWLAAVIRSIEEPIFAELPLPGVPPADIQIRSNGLAGAENLRFAFDFYKLLKGYLARLDRNLAADSRVLDFGCGWGRILRFFLKDVPGDNLYGIDIDDVGIETCRQLMKYGSYSVSHTHPPTHFPAEHFDLVYAYSVFSHLPEDLCLAWVVELSRVLKPGGVLVVTTLGRSFIDVCQRLRETAELDAQWKQDAAESFEDAAAAHAAYDGGQLLFSPHPSPTYGMTLIPKGHVQQRWKDTLELCDFLDDPAVLPQAIIVRRKPAVPFP